MKTRRKIGILLMISVLVLGLFYIATPNIKASVEYQEGIYTDADGVRWQYKYDKVNKDITQIAFFDKPDAITEITLPSASDISQSVNDTEMPSDFVIVDSFKFIDTTITETPADINTAITKIDASNAINIEGLYPAVPSVEKDELYEIERTQLEAVKINVILAENSRLGDNVFKNTILNITNLETADYIGKSCFQNAVFDDTELEFTNMGQGYIDVGHKIEYTAEVEDDYRICITLKEDESFKDNNKYRITLPKISYFSYEDEGGNLLKTDITTNTWINKVYLNTGKYNYNTYLTQLNNNYYDFMCYKKTLSKDGSAIDSYAFAGTNITKLKLDIYSVGEAAFKECVSLTNVDLGTKTKILGAEAFMLNTALTDVNYGELAVIGNQAFRECALLTTDISDIDTLAVIYDGAFWGCLAMTHDIVIPEQVSYIGSRGFYSSGIKTIDFNNVMSVGAEVASECPNLTSIDTGSMVNAGWRAFYKNPLLESIKINHLVTTSSEMCAENPSLTDVDFGTLSIIEYRAFYQCTSLKDVKFSDTVSIVKTEAFSSSAIENLDLANVEAIYYAAFENNKLTEIVLPKTLRLYRESNAFNKNDITKATVQYDTMDASLADIKFSVNLGDATEDLKELVVEAPFEDTIKYEPIKINTELSYVKRSVFDDTYKVIINGSYSKMASDIIFDFSSLSQYDIYNASSNEKITLTDGKYEATSFSDFYILCESKDDMDTIYNDIKDIVIPVEYTRKDNVTPSRRGYSSFSDAAYDAQYSDVDNYINVIAPNYFMDLNSLETLTISEGYQFIGRQSFYPKNADTYDARNNIRTINLPSTLKGIGHMAFAYNIGKITDVDGNDSYVEIEFPEGLEYIGYQAFYYCDGLNEYIDLPNLKNIGTNSFSHTDITGIKIHDKLEFFGSHCIFECPKIKEIIFDCDVYALPNSGDNGYNPQRTVYVSDQNFYSHFDNGNKYDLIKFTEKVVTEPCGSLAGDNYPSRAFMYRLNATTVDLEDCGFKNIGGSMFQEANIDTLILPSTITTLNPNAFNKANIKDQITMPETVVKFDTNAFHSANLTINKIPDKLEYIGDSAFYGCEICENPIIPSTVTYIGRSAFNGNGADENDQPYYENVTFDCDLTPNVTCGQNMQALFYNSTIDHFYFTKNVTQLPTNQMTSGTEFYGMTIKTAKFDGLINLPQKAFQDCKELTSIDFSEDASLNNISVFACLNCEKLNEVKFYQNPENTIEIGREAFRNTGFTSIGDDTTGFDLTSNIFTNPNGCAFGECKNLETIYIPNKFNNNEVSEQLCWNCPKLVRADIDYEITKVQPYAFSDCVSLESVFVWGNAEILSGLDTEIDQDTTATTGTSSHNMDTIQIENLDFIVLQIKNMSIDEDAAITIKDSLNGETTYTYDDLMEADITDPDMMVPKTINHTCQVGTNQTTITFDVPEDKYVTIAFLGENTNTNSAAYTITICDVSPASFTIPSDADLYTYYDSPAKAWDETFADKRRNATLQTDATYYPLDEVLYLTSNKPTIRVDAGAPDFDKDDLIVYALRRDGVILESSTWQSKTNHYSRKDSEVEFNIISLAAAKNEKEVYDTIVPMDKVPVNYENYQSMTHNYDGTDLTLGNRTTTLSYTDAISNDILTTDITLNVVKEPNSITAVYNGSNVYIGDDVEKDSITVTLHYPYLPDETTTNFTLPDPEVKVEGNNDIPVQYVTNEGNTLTTNAIVPGVHKPVVNPPVITLDNRTITIDAGVIEYDTLDRILYRVYKQGQPAPNWEEYTTTIDIGVGAWVVEAYQVSKKGFESDIAEENFVITPNPDHLEVESSITDVYAGDELDWSKVTVYVIYEDDSRATVTNYTNNYDKTDLTLGNRDITVYWENLDADFSVNIIEKPRLVTLSGVLRYSNGNPIANKSIKLSSQEGVKETMTNDEGYYEFKEVEVGEYQFAIVEKTMNSETNQEEERVLVTCDVTVVQNNHDTNKDKIDVGDTGDYDISTNIDDDLLEISGNLDIQFKVVFVDWDNSIINEQLVKAGESAIKPADPIRTGYWFIAWDAPFTNIEKDTIIKAQYEKVEYTVTFVDWDDKVIDAQKVKFEESATAPEDPIRTGYKFIGWDKEFNKITADITVKAQYEKSNYTITFVDWDGTVIDTQIIPYLEDATAPEDPTRTGYKFTGWSNSLIDITEDMTIKAQYTKAEYTVIFVDWDDKVLSTQTVKFEESATAPSTPTRTGYTFASWDKEFNKIIANTTIKAQYTKTEYTVTFVDWNDKVLSTQTVKFEEGATAPTNPSRDGYEFTGWDKEFNKITADITIKAQYKEINEAPKTGDATPVTVYMFMMFMSLATIVYLKKKH